ncbi:MAG TPA: hypothetical protein PKM72_10010 [Nitrospirales bacterium]|nr:hypothetical protein [Nitrospirales bacterium]
MKAQSYSIMLGFDGSDVPTFEPHLSVQEINCADSARISDCLEGRYTFKGLNPAWVPHN